MRKLLTSICLALSLAAPCCGFDQGFYKDGEVFSEIMETVNKADKTVFCATTEHIMIHTKDPSVQAIYRTMKESEAELKDVEKKDLLVVWIEKHIQSLDYIHQLLSLKRYRQWAVGLGYKRVLILGCSAFGVRVIYDSESASLVRKSEQSSSNIAESTSVVLNCYSYNLLSVSAGGPKSEDERPELASQEEIRDFLKNQKVKERVEFRLEKMVNWSDSKKTEQLKAFEDFALSLGYKRTIITAGVAFFPIPTIFDSERGGHQRNPYEGFSIKVIDPGKIGAESATTSN